MVDASERQESLFAPVNVASSLFFETPEAIVRRVYGEIRPWTAVPQVVLEYKAFANANSRVSLKDGAIRMQISDLLESAPAPVTEALAHILLGKLYRRPASKEYESRYRMYLNRVDIRRQISAVRQERGRKVHKGAKGIFHNLEEVFDKLNREHFAGEMARPELGWSYVRSRTRLGHFDPSHNMIMISRIFDDFRAPRLALEYVMFHEMLHLHYPVDHSGSRRCVHTPAFKAHEKQFPKYKEAKALLKKMW